MRGINFKKVSLPPRASADEKINILEGHINDLENALEAALDSIEQRISAQEGRDVS